MAVSVPNSVFALAVQLLLLPSGFAETTPRDDPLLAKVREKVTESVDRLPNYLCTQTIKRIQMDPDSRETLSCSQLEEMKRKANHVTTQDRLRLDVGVSGKLEMYAWAGQNRFNDSGILDLVRFGPISTGSFSGFLRAIFTRDAATYQRQKDLIRDGRAMAEYGFSVPRESNTYQFRSPGTGFFYTAYGGTFLVDKVSGDLVELAIQTNKRPEDGGACEQDTTLRYGRVQLNNRDFLLPEESQLKIYHNSGMATENRTTYSACHVFMGESKISFEEPPETGPRRNPAKPAASPEIVLPSGIQFTLVFQRDVNTASIFAGDTVAAKLKHAIKGGRGRTLVPADATIVLRVTKMQEYFEPESTARLVLKVESMDVSANPVRFAAVPRPRRLTIKDARHAPGLVLIARDTLQGGVFAANSAEFNFVLTKAGMATGISKGFEMTWVTATP